MPFSYYIYYRVAADRAPACAACVEALFSAVRRDAGIEGRLLTKRGEPLLWMEVYENIDDPPAFERALERASADSGIQQCLCADTARHVECFESGHVEGRR